MAPESSPNDGYRLGQIAGKVEAIEGNLTAQYAALTKFMADIKVDVHQHNTEVRAEIKEQKRDLENDINKHRLELQQQFKEAQTENKTSIQQLVRWMYLIIGGATVAWFFLSRLADKVWKP